MKIIFKYLKPFVFAVILCFVLLFGQAICDLSLPNLMSDIVTGGIQYSGIDESSPTEISTNGMILITSFMTESDQNQFKSVYSKDGYVYRQNKLNKEEAEIIGDIYGRSVYAFMLFSQSMASSSAKDNSAASDEKDSVSQNFAEIDIIKMYEQVLPMLPMIPQEQINEFITTAAESESSLYNSIGITFTKLFYSENGINVESLQQNYIVMTGLKMLGIAFLGIIATVGVGFFASRVGASVAMNMRHDVFKKVEGFSNNEFDKFSTASLITRTTNDITNVQMLVIMGIKMLCYSPIMAIGGIVMALNTSVSLSWIIAVAVIIMFILIGTIFKIAVPKFTVLQKLVDRVNLVARENLSGMMVIRAFGNEKHEESKFEEANRNLSDTNLFVQRVMSFMMPAMMIIMNVTTLGIVWIGSNAIAESALNIGDMMAFMQYAMQIIMSFLMIAMMFVMVPRAAVSASRIKEVLDTESSVTDIENVKSFGKIKGKICFNDVTFTYNNAESPVLSNISFTAEPGKTTAFIGATGSGKSTLINLIPRFYDVSSGSITIDEIDIREVSQKELRENIGYVPQKGVLFSGDIASNIRYGMESAEKSEIERAIEVAQAKEFVDETDYGIETSIAQGGGNVSGGQKQRLSIARAIIKNAPIYIFDDSFSALDFKTDASLRRALKNYTSNAVVLIVAQRVSTIMNAEQIIVLEDGKIVGKGTHKELLVSCPEYLEIAGSQLAKEEM